MFNIVLSSNEPRSEHLFNALRGKANVIADVNYDHIDPVSKYIAAVLSFKVPRSEWWGNYQMHPLIQRKRRANLQAALAQKNHSENALLMWGSWFHPYKGAKQSAPFYLYIDQSRSLQPTHDEPRTSIYGRKRSYELQTETYRDCAGILCMSEWARRQTLESHSYLPEEKVQVMGWGPCGIDLTQETPAFSNKTRTVLLVTNDFLRKGVDFLVDVAVYLLSKKKDIRFVVIGGDQSYKPRQIPPNLEFTGKIYDRNILQRYFREASVFFMPHRFDRNPHVLVEAMGAGLPLVASSQGGAIELIQNKGTGILCPIGDIEAYASAIVEIIDTPSKLESMGEAGYSLAKSYYNWDSIADRMLSFMKSTSS